MHCLAAFHAFTAYTTPNQVARRPRLNFYASHLLSYLLFASASKGPCLLQWNTGKRKNSCITYCLVYLFALSCRLQSLLLSDFVNQNGYFDPYLLHPHLIIVTLPPCVLSTLPSKTFNCLNPNASEIVAAGSLKFLIKIPSPSTTSLPTSSRTISPSPRKASSAASTIN